MQQQADALGLDLPEGYGDTPKCNVWPDHWSAVQVFLVCKHQWRTIDSRVLGLDLSVVLQVADLYDVGDKRQLVEDVQVIADTAAKLINKQLSEG